MVPKASLSREPPKAGLEHLLPGDAPENVRCAAGRRPFGAQGQPTAQPQGDTKGVWTGMKQQPQKTARAVSLLNKEKSRELFEWVYGR
ncbi:MAG: hypothetical protein D6730_11370 [Bacteroidetes bacterium]|nr:MAG: hypothetical protein D6730_11370 [Bacteroidota bacterium]